MVRDMSCHNWPKMTLKRETRWSRTYSSADGMHSSFHSKLLDGDATITVSELQELWPNWNEEERWDFCRSFACGAQLAEQTELIRYLIEHADLRLRSQLALCISVFLPSCEAMPTLKEWCQAAAAGERANYYQALAHTKDPEVLPFLQKCLSRVWSADGLMESADFQNWIAFDAVHCIQRLLELGEDANSLRSKYETLKQHPDKGTREQTQLWLSSYFEPTSSD
jgi:hypothetical protein